MTTLMPIVVGCKAIIIGGNFTENLGREVFVESIQQKETDILGETVWVVKPVKRMLKVRNNSTDKSSKKSSYAFALGRNLMRIDGATFPKVEEFVPDPPKWHSLVSPELKDAIEKIFDGDSRNVDWVLLHDTEEVIDDSLKETEACGPEPADELENTPEAEVGDYMEMTPGTVVRIINDTLPENIGKLVMLVKRPEIGRWGTIGVDSPDFTKVWVVKPIDPIAMPKLGSTDEIVYVTPEDARSILSIMFYDKDLEVVKR